MCMMKVYCGQRYVHILILSCPTRRSSGLLEPLVFLDLLAVGREGVGALVRISDFASSAPSVPLASARLLAPIDRPGKYLAIGMNYRKHVEEGAKLGIAEPKQQLWFNKQTTSITGPSDGIVKTEVSDPVRKSVVTGSRVSVSFNLGGRVHYQKKKK